MKVYSIMEVKKVYGYCRVSTLSQSEEGDSLETQENKIREYCTHKKLELISIYREGGVSGAIEPSLRPQMKILLANIEAGNANGLVVCKIDRLSRSTKDFVNFMAMFKNNKFDFFCINPDIDSTSTTGKFTVNLLAIVAELERDMIKDRVKEVMTMKKNKNELVGSVPFGKRLLENSNILVDDEGEQKTILMAMELRSQIIEKNKNGKIVRKPMSYKSICEELVKRGRRNKEGKSSFYPSQIRRMLNGGSYKSGKNVVKKNKIVGPL